MVQTPVDYDLHSAYKLHAVVDGLTRIEAEVYSFLQETDCSQYAHSTQINLEALFQALVHD